MINTVIVSGDVDAATIKRVSNLFNTMEGAVPFDRKFGIDSSSLDSVPAATEGALMVEYEAKLLDYFPQVKISSISFNVRGNEITPKVVIANA